MTPKIDILVTGHLCLDLLPTMQHIAPDALLQAGRLLETGPMTISTGGAVSNTGLALHRLGLNVRLLATVGDDLIGDMIVSFMRRRDPALAEFIRPKPNQPSSYSVVLSPQNADRTFLHCPANNATFGVDDIDFALVAQAKLFHLGYPPILPALIADDGAQLAAVFRQATAAGAVTALDMSLPDPEGPAGRVDWRAILARTLPYVDVFVPSIEEILFMLRRDEYDRWRGALLPNLTEAYLDALAGELIAMGVAVAGFKLGEMGMFLRVGGAAAMARLASLGVVESAWADQRVYHPAFVVEVVGTTGAGDSAYAGLLAGIVRGMPPAEAVRLACAVGACNVEAADATSGVRSFEETTARIAAGWPLRQERLHTPG